jgi:hypothetical protein
MRVFQLFLLAGLCSAIVHIGVTLTLALIFWVPLVSLALEMGSFLRASLMFTWVGYMYMLSTNIQKGDRMKIVVCSKCGKEGIYYGDCPSSLLVCETCSNRKSRRIMGQALVLGLVLMGLVALCLLLLVKSGGMA